MTEAVVLHNGYRSPWTDEMVGQLKKLWLDGSSATEIAVELGGLTRNAVIGKLHRIGLTSESRPRRTAPIRTRTQQNRDRGATQRININKSSRPLRMAEQRKIAQLFPALDAPSYSPKSLDITFDELRWLDGKPSNCRDPQGEAPFLYCGQPIIYGSSYCRGCHAKNYGRHIATPEQIERAAKMRSAKLKVWSAA